MNKKCIIIETKIKKIENYFEYIEKLVSMKETTCTVATNNFGSINKINEHNINRVSENIYEYSYVLSENYIYITRYIIIGDE